MNLFIYLQSKSLIVITVLLKASCRFVDWDSYISLILNSYQNLYMYMTIDNPTFLISLVGLGKNTGTPVYRGISLAWYVPRHTCPYHGILVFLFLVTENIKSQKY